MNTREAPALLFVFPLFTLRCRGKLGFLAGALLKKYTYMSKSTKLTTLTPKISLERVDKETNTLHGIQVMNTGLIQGHGMYADSETIDILLNLAGDRDIKTYFGHPAASSPRIGTDLGVLSNLSRNEKGIIGDLRLFKAGMKEGGIGSFVMDMAINDPKHIGNSVELKGKKEAKTIVINTSDILKGYDFLSEDQEGLAEGETRVVRNYMRPTLFASSAIVSKGAATDKLFSADFFGEGDIAHKITDFLDANEDVRKVLTTNPDIMGKVTSYLSTYKIINNENSNSKLTNKPKNKMVNKEEVKNLTTKDVADTVDAVLSARAKAEADAKAIAESKAVALAEKQAQEEEISNLTAEVEQLKSDLAEAKGEAERDNTDASGENLSDGGSISDEEVSNLSKILSDPSYLETFKPTVQ